uniref:Uncharacterized protein n=1 Tax=Panagrolaimus sp. JU765 TaxID=591449 RepID=A0AC34Q682_9BILA
MPTLPPFSFSTPAPFVPSVPVTPAPVPAPVPVPVQSPLPVPVQAPLPAPVQAPLPAPAPASFVPQITPQVVPAQPALPIPVAAPTQPTINFIPAQGSRSIQLVPANQYKDRAELWFRENFDASACAKNPDEIAEKFLQKFPKKLLKNNKEVILAQLLSTRLKQCFEKQQKNTWNKANEQLANLKLSTSEENECRSGLVQEQISCLNVQSYACQFIHPKYNFRLVPTRIIIQEARLAEDGAEKCRKQTFSQQPTPQLQCPCYMIPGTTECLQYDTRFQASSIDEAIASFNDLTLDESSVVAPMGSFPPPPVDKHCNTEECQVCREYLRKKLKNVGLLPPTTQTMNLTNSTVPCGKYNFAKKPDDDDSSSNEDDDHKKDFHDSDEVKDKVHFLKKDLKKKFKHHRDKRQVSNQTTVVGRRFNLSCERKGVATDGSGMLMLCSRCWAWRELPENYSPRYMNELICDDVDNACLSGYATCGISHRSAYVVRNDSGVFSVITLQAGSFCECRVKSGSALESLVTGAQGSPLPSVLPQSIATQPPTQKQDPIPNQNSGSNPSGNLLWY